MNQAKTDIENVRLSVKRSTHAPLLERFVSPDRGHEPVGEPERGAGVAPVDPETGAEYRALGGTKHRYSTDYKVGPSYPATGFIFAVDLASEDALAPTLTHERVKAICEAVGLGLYCTREVIVPQGYDAGTPTWVHGWMTSPPGRAMGMLRDAERALERHADDVYNTGHVVEAHFWADD